MAVKPGYKQTEVGVIPEEWDVKPISSVLSKGRLGGNYANQDAETELPLMKMGNLARGCFDLSKVQFIGPGIAPDPIHQLVCGDVLFNTRNTLDLVGKVAIWRDELPVAYYNSNLMRLEFDPEKICSNEYANYALNTEGSISRLRGLATGTTSVAAIYTRDLLKLQIPVPPLSEQQAIARALSDVDALLRALERLIAKRRDLKQAAMQQLLTGQVRLPGFYGEWEVKRVSQFGQIVTGGTPSTEIKDLWGEGYPWITPSDISPRRDMYESERSITRLGLGTIRALPANTVLVTCIASIGKNAILKTSGGCNQQINAVIPGAESSAEYLYYLFEANKNYLLASAGTTATSIISKAVFSELEFRVPPFTEQTGIAAVLSDMDAELAALEQRLVKTRALKQGMMQELLTGRTRLV